MRGNKEDDDITSFWDEVIQKRMETVLCGEHGMCLKYLKDQNHILNTLDEETRRKFELFAGSLYEMVGKEYEQLYCAGLSDGWLLCNKMIFRQ